MDNSEFFGRESDLNILRKRICAIKDGYRQNIAIIADKDIGKTSLTLRFLNQFDDPLILPLYLELRPEYSKEQFIRKFIGVLLYNFLKNSNIVLNENIDYLILKAEGYIPKTITSIKLILNSLKRKGRGQSRENTLVGLLTLCDILYSETGKYCVIILDEFHHLGSLGIKQIYKQFSKILMIQKNVLYIILSSAKSKAKKILSSHLALLFGNFEIIQIQPFDLKTTEKYLLRQFARKGIQTEKCLIDFLIHFTGGLPLYLKIITDFLYKTLEPLNKEYLAKVIQDLLFVESGILNQRFNIQLRQLQSTKDAQAYQDLLYLIADGQNKIKDMSAVLRMPKAQVLSRLNLLIENDVIAKSGDFFLINDRVFGFWLRFVYREKSDSLNFNTEEQKKIFRSQIEEKIDQFISDNRKSVLERTKELLHLFENASIQMNAKKIRLKHFHEVKLFNFSRGRLNEGLLGRSKDALWIMAVKPNILTEEDIAEFARHCHRFRYNKPQRKIIITDRDIDTNVRLKAMEEKVLTWDLNDLNLILDLYNKSRVIP
ncbi:ATP-binding protein [Candidatus Omnitrophota bacterium]